MCSENTSADINNLNQIQYNIDEMFSKFENYFEEHSIYKTLFICSCDEEVYDMLDVLEDAEYSVSVLFYDDMYNERDNFYNKLHDFNTDHNRIFLISYQTWAIINSEIKVYILPNQNLIIYGDISDDGIKTINNWIYNACQCGFITESPRILELCN